MKDSLKYLSLVTQLGVTIIVTVAICTAFGLYLDRRLNTGAVFTLVFLLIGCLAALWNAYRLISDTFKTNSERK
ncbi:MAG TPA: AtpZ/AtpI family protein [Limnochordia bacterium]|nr:AtpZ/AtpI family protein [Limnochordia bacterium]